jgi:hypothetical protein
MKTNALLKFSVGFFSLVSVVAQATGPTVASTTQRIASEIGTQQALTALATCNIAVMASGSSGNIGTPNQLLCVMKTLNITGPTTAAGVTTQVTISSQTLTIHYIVDAPGATIDGTAYAYDMKVWTCGSGCTTVSAFLPAIYIAFNASSDGTISNGVLSNNFGADSGSIKGSAFIKWDMGSATTTKFFTINMVDCSSTPYTAVYGYYTKVGTVSSLYDLTAQGSGVTRTAVMWDNSTGIGNWNGDSLLNAGGDSPAWLGGFTRTASGTDYTYSAQATSGSLTMGTYPTAMPGATLSGATNQGACAALNVGVSYAAITAANGVAAITNGTNVLTTPLSSPMGGMPLNPPNI